MNEIVKKHGKRMIVWEGFKVKGKIPDSQRHHGHGVRVVYELPQNYAAAGYKVINTAWQPLYVVNDRNWSPEKILSWNMYHWENWWLASAAYGKGIDVPPTPLVIGAADVLLGAGCEYRDSHLAPAAGGHERARMGSQDAAHVCRLLEPAEEHRRQTNEVAATAAGAMSAACGSPQAP